MSLYGLSIVKVLSLLRVFVPLRWKRRGVGMVQPRLFGILKFLLKLVFLAWAASKGKIPMEDKLKRRNFSGPSRCSLCLEEEESVDHLLVHCLWVSSLWDLSL